MTLTEDLKQAIIEYRMLPREGTRELAGIRDITPKGYVVGNYDSKLCELTEVLVDTEQVFNFDGRVVMELGSGELGSLATLADSGRVESAAASLLTNFMICEAVGKDGVPLQFPVPSSMISNLLHRHVTRHRLPQIVGYYRRPIFNEQFSLLSPGYHAAERVLIHGPEIAPVDLGAVPATTLPIVERLPPHLRQLLRDFCFASAADLANAVGMLLTGLLVNLHIEEGKPFFVLTGNQPGLGKTWLALVCGILLDGVAPHFDAYSPDEAELGKCIGARIRTSDQSILVIDNARVPQGDVIQNPFLEQCITAPVVSGRILGTTTTYSRPNDRVWLITMNGARLGSDLTARCGPIRFYWVGDPKLRDLGGRKPIEYARRHRREILGELAGMVYRWVANGCQAGTQPHRMERWASQVGGIMAANGLPEFLTNLDEASAAFDDGRAELAALAEHVVRDERGGPFVRLEEAGDGVESSEVPERAKPPLDWSEYFTRANVRREALQKAADQGRRTLIGNFLTPHVNRSIELDMPGGRVRVILRMAEVGGKRKAYWFDVVTLEVVEEAEASVASCNKSVPRHRP